MKKSHFIVNAKKEFSQLFRDAFMKMNASFTECDLYIDEGIIRFEVECDLDKAEILHRDVPFHAYASLGVAGDPTLFE